LPAPRKIVYPFDCTQQRSEGRGKERMLVMIRDLSYQIWKRV